MMTGASYVLVGTRRYGATSRVWAVVAGTAATLGVMAVVKSCERLVRARSVSSTTVAKGAAGSRLYSVPDRVLAETVATSTREGAGMTHWCRNTCTVSAMRSAQVFGK